MRARLAQLPGSNASPLRGEGRVGHAMPRACCSASSPARMASRAWCGSRASPPSPTRSRTTARSRTKRGARGRARDRRRGRRACCSRASKASPTATPPSGSRACALYLPRAALPPPEEDEFYHADLLGLPVELGDGTHAGHGARGPRLRRRRQHRDRSGPKARRCVVPFTRAAVPVVDIAGRPHRRRPPGLLAPEAEARLSMAWQATVLTIFPEMFPGPLGHSLAGKALGRGHVAAATRWTSAISRAISTARSTTRRSAAGRAW